MPAASDSALPRTLRPLGIRIIGTAGGLFLLVCFTAFWFALPEDIRAQFTLLQKGTVLLLCVGIAACLFPLVRSRVDVTAEGLTVINGYRTRRFAWAQIVAIRMPQGAPWASLDLADGTTCGVMALQASDGVRAREGVRFIREYL